MLTLLAEEMIAFTSRFDYLRRHISPYARLAGS
jgi:hypothetical protein